MTPAPGWLIQKQISWHFSFSTLPHPSTTLKKKKLFVPFKMSCRIFWLWVMEIKKKDQIFFPVKYNFYFPMATCKIIRIDDIIEEMNIKNNSLCTKHIA